MITSTKSTNIVPMPKDISERIILELELDENYKILNNALCSAIESEDWIKLNKEEYYFIPEDGLIIPNPKTIRMESERFVKLPGLRWTQMEKWIAQKWFCERKDQNPMISESSCINYTDSNDIQRRADYIYCYDTKIRIRISDGHAFSGSVVASRIAEIRIPIYRLSQNEKENVMQFLIANELNPFMDETYVILFDFLVKLNTRGILGSDNSGKVFSIKDIDDYDFVLEKLSRMGSDFNSIKVAEQLMNESYCLDDSTLQLITKKLLDCDKIRANMETYPEHILQDPESGHWDLWDNGNSELCANISTNLIARNPVYDALNNKSGVVGIDFGTKSTVVTYRQSRADILPMRIGSGQFSRAVSKNDYENPTVMELRNFKKFMEDYRQYEGRPYTAWEDLLISHEAAEQLKSEQSKGDTFATFFSELKQWASNKSRQVKLRDLQGNEINIPSYLSLSEDDFDPIEVYAYYLGLFINNMVHKIYLRYKLSFPATVEKVVRDKMLDSFTKGIKKSLPMQVLEDANCMKIFKVEQGASEPAAYAITALYGYGFEPEEDEKHYYGIFDFGGGTTDFDFGVLSSEEKEPENYDYQISHFGQGGDPYLGGENLLQILADQVFIKNYDKLLEDKIVFVRPSWEKAIPGKDYLICPDSQYAHFNQKRLMEKLRGVWEGEKDIIDTLQSGSVTLPLFSMDGESMDNYFLEVDLDELEQLLEERIDNGVAQFFDALKNCFGVYENQKDIHNVEEINIFLAGNSSKSPLVYKSFKKYIDEYKKGLFEREKVQKEWFKLYPPLGTVISDEILKGNMKPLVDDIISYIDNTLASGDDVSEEENFNVDDLSKPTGKTGVAYGLLNNRVRVVQNETEEIGFRYYIGQNRKNKFYCVIDKDNQKYNVWTRFCTASREEFDIWFTRSATAPTNKMPIDQIGVYSETGYVTETSGEKAVFIRLVSPTEIEYVVASEEEIADSSFEGDLVERVSLQEKQ